MMTDVGDKNKWSETSDEKLAALEAKADELYKAAALRFENTYRQQNASKARWFEEVSRAGTFSDRMSMVQLRVQRSPMFSLEQVERLVDALPKKGHRESHTTMSLLRDLFLQEFLPSDRKLISFSRRPLKEVVRLLDGKLQGERAKEAEERLVEWKYESDLKKCYTKFLTSVESNASSSLEGIAEVACATLLRLLVDRPEQEAFLLRALVNKLGHPSRKVASRVAQYLGELVQAHSNMRTVVVDEVAQLIFRKNISERAQYYAVHFLSRLFLQAGEFDLAHKLIKLYLNLFKVVIAKCEHDHPLITLLITGINRAVPYARSQLFEESGTLVAEMDKLYAFVHNSKFSIALNVLKLLFNIHSSSDGLPDRFYASFYRRLLTVRSNALNRQFFDFFLRAVKNDGVEVRVRAFLKRLFQIALAAPAPEFTVAALMLADMAIRERPSLLVLTKSADKDVERKTAIKKEPKKETKPMTNGHGLKHIVGAYGDADPTLRNNGTLAADSDGVSSDDEKEDEERYYDVRTESDDEDEKAKSRLPEKKPTLDFKMLTKEKRKAKLANGAGPAAKRSRVVEFGGMTEPRGGPVGAANAPLRYNPLARNPLFVNANLAVDVELLALSRHYHPTVQIFAKKLIAGERIDFNNDPLEHFTALRFIERFSIKNPKKKDNTKFKPEAKEEKDADSSDDDVDDEELDGIKGGDDVSDVDVSDENEKMDDDDDIDAEDVDDDVDDMDGEDISDVDIDEDDEVDDAFVDGDFGDEESESD